MVERAANIQASEQRAAASRPSSAHLAVGTQLHSANQFQAGRSGCRKRGIVAGERVVIGNAKRFNPSAHRKANNILGSCRAVGTVRVCVQIDQIALRAYLLGAEYMSATRKLR